MPRHGKKDFINGLFVHHTKLSLQPRFFGMAKPVPDSVHKAGSISNPTQWVSRQRNPTCRFRKLRTGKSACQQTACLSQFFSTLFLPRFHHHQVTSIMTKRCYSTRLSRMSLTLITAVVLLLILESVMWKGF